MNTKYDWSKVPNDVQWIATNGSGKVSGFTSKLQKPRLIQDLWYGLDFYTGEPKYFGMSIAPHEDWENSLEERPK